LEHDIIEAIREPAIPAGAVHLVMNVQ